MCIRDSIGGGSDLVSQETRIRVKEWSEFYRLIQCVETSAVVHICHSPSDRGTIFDGVHGGADGWLSGDSHSKSDSGEISRRQLAHCGADDGWCCNDGK